MPISSHPSSQNNISNEDTIPNIPSDKNGIELYIKNIISVFDDNMFGQFSESMNPATKIDVKVVGVNGINPNLSANTIHAVKAIECAVLIIYSKAHRAAYVVPPHTVIKIVSYKCKGQYSSIPYENITLGLNDFIDHKDVYKVKLEDLGEHLFDCVCDAILESESKKNSKYINIMKHLNTKINELKKDIQFMIQTIE